MKHIFRLFLILNFSITFGQIGQKNVFLNLTPKFGNQDFQLFNNYTGNDGVVVELEHFNYYLSNVKLFHDNGLTTSLDLTWLVTPSNFNIYLGYLVVDHIDSVSFMIGVPKALNTQSGALAQDISSYPETHPLSFQMPSMYWGWAFGYMHMIVGGKADSNNDNVPNSYFELHNLGNDNQQMVVLPVIQTDLTNQTDLNLNCHVDRWLNNINLASVGILHDDSGLNLTVMENVISQQVFTLDASAGLTNQTSELFKWHQINGEIVFESAQNNLLKSIEFLDAHGRVILGQSIDKEKISINTSTFTNGIYLVKVNTKKGNKVFRIFI